nr:putative zinc finger, CCHC-type [Tanacetum cinerariifolium]
MFSMSKFPQSMMIQPKKRLKLTKKHYDDANKVSCIMASSMSPELQKTFENTWAYEMNQQLKEMFQAKASKEHHDVVKSLMACKPKPKAIICAFILKMKGYFDRMESLNMYILIEQGGPKEDLRMKFYLPQEVSVWERAEVVRLQAEETKLEYSRNIVTNSRETPSWREIVSLTVLVKLLSFTSKPGLQSMTSGHISSGLDLTYAPSTITTQQPSEGELDLLFEAMYDDYIGGQPSTTARTVPPAQEPQVRQSSKASTTIADTDPIPTNSSSLATNIPITSQDVDELNANAMVDGNTFVNPFANSSTSAAAASSSQNVDPSNMHTFYQPYPHEFQWTKDHPLEQVIGEPS